MKMGILAGALIIAIPAAVSAATFTVDSKDNIYGAGQASAPGGGNVPTAVQALRRHAVCITISKVVGSIPCSAKNACIVLNDGTGNNTNDADGFGAAVASSSNTGTSLISGLVAPHAGYLVGLFTRADGPKAAPAALDFTTGEGTAFTSLSPALDQTFFIGDGQTGHKRGAAQTFMVPSGAGKLWLGISDAPNYQGAPGAYGDNLGSYTVGLSVHKDTCP